MEVTALLKFYSECIFPSFLFIFYIHLPQIYNNEEVRCFMIHIDCLYLDHTHRIEQRKSVLLTNNKVLSKSGHATIYVYPYLLYRLQGVAKHSAGPKKGKHGSELGIFVLRVRSMCFLF